MAALHSKRWATLLLARSKSEGKGKAMARSMGSTVHARATWGLNDQLALYKTYAVA